jgi:hypothetical protein
LQRARRNWENVTHFSLLRPQKLQKKQEDYLDTEEETMADRKRIRSAIRLAFGVEAVAAFSQQ